MRRGVPDLAEEARLLHAGGGERAVRLRVLAFLALVDVPMYLGRWRAGLTDGSKSLGVLEGLRDVSTRWVVTHDFAEWKDEIAWMSLYFSAAVWASLALCVVYALDGHLPQYRTAATSVYSAHMQPAVSEARTSVR